MTDLATLKTRLSEAETALHELLTGKRRVRVSRSGTEVQYQSDANGIAALKAYIADLKNEISAAATGNPARRIMNLYF